MEDKIITINCHGSIEEIIFSLKEIVSKIEDDYKTDMYSKFEVDTRIESYSKSVVLTVLK